MWCAQFKSAERTFDLSQPSLFCVDTIRKCGLSATQISNIQLQNLNHQYYQTLNKMK